jgi:hypothetical protein
MVQTNGINLDDAVVQPYGNRSNRILNAEDLAGTLVKRNRARLDLILRRRDFEAAVVETGDGPRFGFKVSGQGDPFRPTGVGLSQAASLTKVHLDDFRRTAARYPALAADIFNTWWHDADILNRTGTARQRKKKVDPNIHRQLIRNFLPTNGDGGVMRAILSSSYRIIDNHDVASVGLDEAAKTGNNLTVSGALSDRTMFLDIMTDVRSEITFPEKGRGHKMIRVPCGAGLRLKGSDVGLSTLVACPLLMVYSCSNLLVSTEELRQIHIGADYSDLTVLSESTIRKMNESLFARLRDVVRATMVKDEFDKVVEIFSENAGYPVENPRFTIENVSKKFSLPESTGTSILDRFVKEADEVGNSRFALAQAFTAEGREVAETDFERAVGLQEIGSNLLRMAQKDFAKTIDVEVK